MDDRPWRRYTLENHNRLNYSRLEYLAFIAVGASAATLANWLLGNPSSSDPLLVYAKLVWLFYLPVALLNAIGILAFRPREDFHLERRAQKEDYKVIFQITTRGFSKGAVEKSVRSVLYWAPRYLGDFEVWIVTEDDVDKEFFDRLAGLDDRVKVIYVPRGYETPRKTRYKARALHYAVELRRRMGLARPDVWVYLMDEESIVGEDTVLGIIEFVEDEAPKGKLLGQGLIVYSNHWGRNLLTSMEDSLRAFDDVSRYKLQARLGMVLVGIHGSHLLVRADIEASIGWDFGPVRAEDTVFGLLVNQKYGRVWGWLRGKLYEQSPFTLRDLLRQRRRWVWGTLDLLGLGEVRLPYRLAKVVFLFSWLASLPSIIVALANIVAPGPAPTPLLAPLYGFELATVVYAFLEGLRLNTKPAGVYTRGKALLNTLAIPLLAVVEALAPYYTLATYRNSRKVGFEVIVK